MDKCKSILCHHLYHLPVSKKVPQGKNELWAPIDHNSLFVICGNIVKNTFIQWNAPHKP